MSTPERLCYIALQQIDSVVGPAKIHQLIELLGGVQKIFSLSVNEIAATGILTSKQQEALAKLVASDALALAEMSERQLHARGIQALTLADDNYPERLRQVSVAPLALYINGDEGVLGSRVLLAVVGSRKNSDYAARVMKKIIPELVQAGAVIVSGLAFGVDTLAHVACLESGQKTIAVQARGVDQALPRTQQRHFEKIMRQGCVVSEFPLVDAHLDKSYFPRRNRLISGLSDAVIVIEAGEKSGALITARFASEQGRDVFAVPDSIFSPYSLGSLGLIQQGAMPVSQAKDILNNMPRFFGGQMKLEMTKPDQNKICDYGLASEIEKKLLELCQIKPLSLDELVEMTGSNTAVITQTAMKLELTGRLCTGKDGKFGLL